MVAKDKADRKCTISEKMFVDEMTRLDENRPRSANEAYRTAYDPKGNARTVQKDANTVFNRPHVQKAIAVIESKIEADRRRASRGTLQRVQTKLWDIVDGEHTSDRDVIAALKGIRDMMPKDIVEDSPNIDSAASKEELVQRLQAVLSDVPDAIEVGPVFDEDGFPDEDEGTSEADVIEIHLVSPGDVIEDVDEDEEDEAESGDPEY
jgi:hypothetical protein